MSETLIVGIDMAKKDFAVATRVGNQEKPLNKFSNEASGFAQLREQVKQQCQSEGLSQVHLIVEATGGYEAALVAYAYENGWLVSMPNPKQVRDWAKGMGYRVKTAPSGHPVDARILAHYGQAVAPWSKPCKKSRHASRKWRDGLALPHKSFRVSSR